MTPDIDYYRARALEELERAAAASEPSIATIHRDLAAKYESLADRAETQPTWHSDWGGMSDARSA